MKRILAIPLLVLALLFITSCEEGKTYTYVFCKIDDQPEEQCKSPINYPDLPPGPHVIRVCALNAKLINKETDEWKYSPISCDEHHWTVLPKE